MSVGFVCCWLYVTSSCCTTTDTCLVFSSVALAEALDHQPLFTGHNDLTALNGAVDDEGKWRGQRDRQEKKNRIIYNAVCFWGTVCVYAPACIGVRTCVFKTCASGCVLLHQRIHMWTRAYLCGRMGPAFDKRGSVCPVVKYGDER